MVSSEFVLFAGYPHASRILAARLKNIGIINKLKMVDAMVPPRMVLPSEFLAPAPAPVAMTSGNIPPTNAKAVIKMGRNRTRVASRGSFSRVGAFLPPRFSECDD